MCKNVPVIGFARLPEIDPLVLLQHMTDQRIARHLPLLGTGWDEKRIATFVRDKESCWERDGLGHWAILIDQAYAGWGGFQKEGDDWDFGLVLRPECFTLGRLIFEHALDWLSAHRDIAEVTFLLPLSRSRRAPETLGARFCGEVVHAGTAFTKWSITVPRKLASGVPLA